MAFQSMELRGFIQTLESWGLTDVLLPFLLVFTIIFAILQKSNILGEGKKNFNVISLNILIENLEKYAKIKGVNLLGTSDFTHPEWIKELKQELTEDETGILKTKNNMGG